MSKAELEMAPMQTTIEPDVGPAEYKEDSRLGGDANLSPNMVKAVWAFRICSVVFCLYFFLFSLDLMGGAFKVIGGCTAGSMFESIDNPIAGLMVGILATVLVQSSSTSTSIVVALVGSGAMDVRTGIPVIMGANIGTSVTNTIVAMGQMNNAEELEKAFAGATVHDMFNFATVVILLPIELVTRMLEKLSESMVSGIEVTDGDSWEGPVKVLVAPLVKRVLNANKDVIKAVAKGETCESFYAVNATTGLRLNAKGLIKCDSELGCPLFYAEEATMSDDQVAGSLCLFLSLLLMVGCLVGLVTALKSIVMNSSEKWIRKATDINPYLAILVGVGATILVQSSSITTSVLTPLVGMGVVTVEQMFPLTLGANIGTTGTALLASLVSDKVESVQIAICHLFFNIFGILIFFPIPWMRQWPIRAAKELGHMTQRWKGTPVGYIVFAFVIVPGVLLGISSMFTQGTAAYDVLGTLLTITLLAWISYSVFWWFKRDGRSKFFDYLASRQHKTDVYEDIPKRWKTLVQSNEQLVASNAKLQNGMEELRSLLAQDVSRSDVKKTIKSPMSASASLLGAEVIMSPTSRSRAAKLE